MRRVALDNYQHCSRGEDTLLKEWYAKGIVTFGWHFSIDALHGDLNAGAISTLGRSSCALEDSLQRLSYLKVPYSGYDTADIP